PGASRSRSAVLLVKLEITTTPESGTEPTEMAAEKQAGIVIALRPPLLPLDTKTAIPACRAAAHAFENAMLEASHSSVKAESLTRLMLIASIGMPCGGPC